MRFFSFVCLFGILVASLGCMTRNWSVPLFGESNEARESREMERRPHDISIFSSGNMERQLFGDEPETKKDAKRPGLFGKR